MGALFILDIDEVVAEDEKSIGGASRRSETIWQAHKDREVQQDLCAESVKAEEGRAGGGGGGGGGGVITSEGEAAGGAEEEDKALSGRFNYQIFYLLISLICLFMYLFFLYVIIDDT